MARRNGKNGGVGGSSDGSDRAGVDSKDSALNGFGGEQFDSAHHAIHANSTAETQAQSVSHAQIGSYYPYYDASTHYDPTVYHNYATTPFQYVQQTMAYNYNQYANPAYGAGYANGAPPGYPAQYAQQQQTYQATPPQIRNPFAPPAPPASVHPTNANYDPEHEQQLAQWHAQYATQDPYQNGKKGVKSEQTGSAQRVATAGANANEGADGKGKTSDDGKFTVVRKGGGEQWEDKSLLEWDPKQFRIMVGNLAGEVTDDSLAKAFAAYGVAKARVVRDKRTTKSKGYGFVAFTDHDHGFKAAREMTGKYIGSHPVTIQRSKTNVQPMVKKDQHKGKGRNNNRNDRNKDKVDKDPLRANTHAGVEKKAAPKAPPGLKLLG